MEECTGQADQMTKETNMAVYAQLRDCYKQCTASQLQALMRAYVQSKNIPPEEEEKFRTMWRIMVAEYRRKQK